MKKGYKAGVRAERKRAEAETGEPQWGRDAAEWHRYLHQEGILVPDEGEDCGPWHHRVFLHFATPAEPEAAAELDVERLVAAERTVGMPLIDRHLDYWRRRTEMVLEEYAIASGPDEEGR